MRGLRCAHSVVVIKAGTPPAAGTCIMPFPTVPKMIMSSRFHAPPRTETEASQISCGGPPEMSIFFSLFPA